MDQITHYKTIVKQLLDKFVSIYGTSMTSDVDYLRVYDDENAQYMILRHGWDGKRRVQGIPLFARLIDNKVWVEEDWTDFEFVDRLLDAGIKKQDIVLAFHHPTMRKFTEFAVA